MSRPRLLDLFCGAGGAAMGYHRAGFDVVGVDINPQPRYPFLFHQGDALELPTEYLVEFDAIHASPPCQAHSTLRHSPGAADYPDLVEATRALLGASGRPYVIENVVGAPLINPITLCGSMVGLEAGEFQLRRHRLFESNHVLFTPSWCSHRLPVLGVYGDLSKNQRPSTRGVKAGVAQAERLMGIDWMTRRELVQAIPPAYTEWIGTQLLAHLSVTEGSV